MGDNTVLFHVGILASCLADVALALLVLGSMHIVSRLCVSPLDRQGLIDSFGGGVVLGDINGQ